MLILCEKCNNEINKVIRTHRRYGVDRLYLSCEKCGKEYDVMYQDEEMRRLIKTGRSKDKINKKNIENEKTFKGEGEK